MGVDGSVPMCMQDVLRWRLAEPMATYGVSNTRANLQSDMAAWSKTEGCGPRISCPAAPRQLACLAFLSCRKLSHDAGKLATKLVHCRPDNLGVPPSTDGCSFAITYKCTSGHCHLVSAVMGLSLSTQCDRSRRR